MEQKITAIKALITQGNASSNELEKAYLAFIDTDTFDPTAVKNKEEAVELLFMAEKFFEDLNHKSKGQNGIYINAQDAFKCRMMLQSK